MVAYGIGIISLIKDLKAAHTDVTQTWYTGNAGALGKYGHIKLYFNSPRHSGPDYEYYPETSKIILIMHLDNLETGKQFGLRHGFKVCTVACYIGGFIGNKESKRDWLKDHTATRENDIYKTVKTTLRYHQEIYSAVVQAIPS